MDRATKVCAQCNIEKSVSDYYSRGPGRGPLAYCKPCHSKRSIVNERRRRGGQAKPRDRFTAGLPAGMRRCSKCEAVLPLTDFPSHGDRPRSVCLLCHRENNREYKATNQEKTKQSNARYRDANKGLLAERQRRWREEHPEDYRAIHARWKQRNTDAVNAATHRRRNHITVNGGHWTAAEWLALKLEYDHRCLMCERQEPDVKLTVDHIIPVSDGGANTIDNIQPLCKSCNSKKHRGIVDLRQRARST